MRHRIPLQGRPLARASPRRTIRPARRAEPRRVDRLRDPLAVAPVGRTDRGSTTSQSASARERDGELRRTGRPGAAAPDTTSRQFCCPASADSRGTTDVECQLSGWGARRRDGRFSGRFAGSSGRSWCAFSWCTSSRCARSRRDIPRCYRSGGAIAWHGSTRHGSTGDGCPDRQSVQAGGDGGHRGESLRAGRGH